MIRLVLFCLLFLGLSSFALAFLFNPSIPLVIIEFKQGDVRSGISRKGVRWEQEMYCHYGYFSSIKGKDGEPLDVYVNPDTNSIKIFRITQLNVITKEFDEYKIMLGFNTIQQAKQMYLSHFPDDWAGYGSIEEISSYQLINE